MTRIFIGDYSTGDFNQWGVMMNKYHDAPPATYNEQYPAQVISEQNDCGYIARYEVRTGDVPDFGGNERSEVTSDDTIAAAGTTRWYAFSTKFDSTFPLNHEELGFAFTTQFADDLNVDMAWGFFHTGVTHGFGLNVQKHSAAGVQLGAPVRLIEVPIDPGNWHDIEMEVKWSSSDAEGYVKVWLNGIRQTVSTGGETWTGRTMTPGSTITHVNQGYYRALGIVPTGIVYHTGFRMADSEDSL